MRVDLTRKGWSLLGGAVGLFLASRLLGSREVAALAIVAMALVVAVLAWVRVQRPELEAIRSVTPRSPHTGSHARVDLVVRNVSDRATPVLVVSDLVGRRRAARFLLPPLHPGGSERAAYRIPGMRRGRNVVGPLTVTATDPFGLARRRFTVGVVDEIIVRPQVHAVLAPRPSGGARIAAGEPQRSRAASTERGEFLGLRDYEIGDDLRRVHWRSTARRGHLMIREDEARRHPRVGILLDSRDTIHTPPSFELALEAVASIASALSQAHRAVTVIDAHGARIAGGSTTDLAFLLDKLAIAEVAPSGDAIRAAAHWQRASPDSLLVVVTGAPRATEIDALARLGRGPGGALIVATRAGVDGPVVDVSADLVAAWNRATIARGAHASGAR